MMQKSKIVIAVIVLAICSTSTWATERFVVKGNAGAASPYTTWATAAANVQDAIDACNADDLVTVSNGVYNTGSTVNVPDASHTLKTRIALNKAITLRAFSSNPADTVIEGAADPGTGGLGADATRCIYMVDGSTLSGFTLQNGFTEGSGATGVDDSGAGILVNTSDAKSTAVITNCVIKNCTAQEFGGGAYGAATYQDCQINGCSVNSDGGGIYGTSGLATLTSCVISNNYANSRAGGATLVDADDSTFVDNSSGDVGGGCRARAGTYVNCTFRGNTAINYGGGVIMEDGILRDCLFVDNQAEYGGGVSGFNGGTYTGIVDNCIFSNNVATSRGGGIIMVGYGNIWVTNNCLFVTNHARYGGAVYLRANMLVKSATIRNNYCSDGGYGGGFFMSGAGLMLDCTIADNASTNNIGGGGYMIDGIVSNCTINGNLASSKGGGLYVNGSNVVVVGCVVTGNQSTSDSGGGITIYDGLISNCTVSANSAQVSGGGIYMGTGNGQIINSFITRNFCVTSVGGGVNMAGGILRNSLIAANDSLGSDQGGGGVNMSGGIVDSCTIVRNKTPWKGGGVYGFGGTTTNTIIAYNTATTANNDLRETARFHYCSSPDLINGTDNNITALPDFVNSGSGSGTNAVLGEYTLRGSSTCIDAGINESWMANSEDYYGNLRIANGTVDIGCHEYWAKGTVILLQ